jgi:hypothetical protein
VGYVEMMAALSAASPEAARLELLLGWHPQHGRWLTEEEERAWEDLFYISPEALDEESYGQPWVEALRLWDRNFPELRGEDRQRWSAEDLWRVTLQKVTILRIGYAFLPVVGEGDPHRPFDKYKDARQRARELQRQIEDGAAADERSRGKITWTLPFPANGPLGKQVEARAGLSRSLKEGLGLSGVVPGLLHNYFYENAADTSDLLSPGQFEQLVAHVYGNHGWEVQVTRAVKDGGKDAIATKEVDGRRVVAYLEAKRYRSDRAVGLPEVKEFAATVAADRVDQGMLVSTSRFSGPAREWVDGAGTRVATLELVDLEGLRALLGRLVSNEVAAYWL